MCNRFIVLTQGKHASKQTHGKKVSEMSPQEIEAELKDLLLSPHNWLGRKGASLFLVNAKQQPGFRKKVVDAAC